MHGLHKEAIFPEDKMVELARCSNMVVCDSRRVGGAVLPLVTSTITEEAGSCLEPLGAAGSCWGAGLKQDAQNGQFRACKCYYQSYMSTRGLDRDVGRLSDQ
jgi:hypothetical protein